MVFLRPLHNIVHGEVKAADEESQRIMPKSRA